METTTGPPLPLTTTFTPASECLNDFWLLNSQYSGSRSHWANLGPENTRKCLPSGWSPLTYYSPGIACPSGWAMAANYTSAGETIGTKQLCRGLEVPDDVSHAEFCRPSSWAFTTRKCCIDKFWHTIEVCDFGVTANINYTYTHTNTPGITEAAFGSMTAGIDGWNAYGVELRWKLTDLPSAPATTFVSPTTSATLQPSPATTTATEGQEPSERSSSWSIGAKAGTGIGATLGTILIILGICFLLRRRNCRWKYYFREQSDLDAMKSLTLRHETHELDSNPVFRKASIRGIPAPLQQPAELEESVTG
ncbi:hypothetical protein N7475_005118 [Penicillium sp. IBT 31633x]|nr:hypothetical protein N7475_005118 [Penicillium sp. IBT 31633x]